MELIRRGVLEAPPGMDQLIAVAVGSSGPVAMWAPSPGLVDPPRARGQAVSRLPEPVPVVLVSYLDSTVPVSSVASAVSVTFPLIDELSDGSFLVVGARCAHRRGGPENNALVIDRDGRVVREGCLGDGIEHLLVAADGTVWAGYFDEGIFGNRGWGTGSRAREPLGADGVVAWSADLERLWGAGVSVIADVYALNVAGSEVWACTYPDFPLLRMRAGASRVIPTRGLDGARGLVVSGNRVGVIGGYDDPLQWVMGRVEGDRFVGTGRGRLACDVEPRGWSAVSCRGPQAHFFDGPEWYCVELG
ncbi:hypothetical protein EII34_13710 [Arachnia propionica]|uniref:Uncharacterized protein n=1 Tax=Arachnia propionica TaxID=1750 RepID=A0A3P1T499_9ACTN|nr:hypothetical protein [Arachnia propionica]RRD03636.1 hypothetical protein EII34_13710 [Arachnia propionica]